MPITGGDAGPGAPADAGPRAPTDAYVPPGVDAPFSEDPCEGQTCSGRGVCAVIGGTTPTCVCEAGYVARDLACVREGTVGGDLSLLAGALGGPGSVDGSVNTRFNSPQSVTHDAAGNVYVIGASIRRINPDGNVSTLATFENVFRHYPVVDSRGNIFAIVGDAIRRVTPSGDVSTFVPSIVGRFGAGPTTMTIDASDNLRLVGPCRTEIAMTGFCLTTVTPAGGVTSRLVTDPAARLPRPRAGAVALSADGNTIYMVTDDDDVVTIDANEATVTALLGIARDRSGTWLGTELDGICLDGSNNLWLSDSQWGRIYRVPSTGGTATLVAGDPVNSYGYNRKEPRNVDGPGANARFYIPTSLSCDSTRGRVYVADSGNHTIRSVAMGGDNTVSTIAGTPFAIGAVDGLGGAARFRFPQQVVADRAGNWFVADSANAVIRRVTPAGDVSVFAGSFGMRGSVDGTGTAARFNGAECALGYGCRVNGLAIDSSDNLYVADRGRIIPGSGTGGRNDTREPDAIRRVTPAGVVTTLASGSALSSNNAYASFDSIAVDSTNGDVYFNSVDGVRRLRDGAVTLVVSDGDPSSGISVAVDSTRRKLFVVKGVDTPGVILYVQRYDLSGATPSLEATLCGAGCVPNAPFLTALSAFSVRVGQVAVAPNGALAITFPLAHVIVRVDPTFSRLDTIVGELNSPGVELGPLPARLTVPTGVAFDATGQLGIVMGRRGSLLGEGALLVTSGFTP